MLNLFQRKLRLEVGMTVEANYNGQGKWYKGQIKKDRGNGTFDIEFENGKNENAVPLKMIKSLETSVSYSSLAEKSVDSHTSRFKIPAIEDHFPQMFESAVSSKAPSVAGDDHSVTSANSSNSRANKTSISKFFHFGSSTPTTPVVQILPPTIIESKVVVDNVGIVNQAKATLSKTVVETSTSDNNITISQNNLMTKTAPLRKKHNTTNMKERIRRFYEIDSKDLDLSELDLVTLPAIELMSLVESVKNLNVSRNLLTSLLNIHLFSNVLQLDLSHNRLTSLGSLNGGLSSLCVLKRIDLSRNALTDLTTELLSLSSLEALILHHNQLTALPSQNQLSSLKSLRLFDVSYNRLSVVSDELEALTRLDELNLSHNRDEAGREMDFTRLGGRARDLHEKRELFVSKGARRVLVSRAIDVQKRVVAREQQRIVQEYSDSHRTTVSRGGASRESDHHSPEVTGTGSWAAGGVRGVSSGRVSPAHLE